MTNVIDLLFCHGAFDVIVLNDDILFKNLDGKDFLSILFLCQHDFAKGAFAENLEEAEVL